MQRAIGLPQQLLDTRNRLEMEEYGRLLTDDEREEVRKERSVKEFDVHVQSTLDLPIPLRFRDATFDNFECYNDKLVRVVEHLKSGKSAVIYGKNGTGKTHLAFAACRYHRECGKSVRYVDAFEMFDTIKRTFSDSGAKEMVNLFVGYDYLVIDELDKAYGTQTDFVYFYKIINARHNEMRHTVVITNADKASLQAVVGASALDRLATDGALIEMVGENYRNRRK